MKLNQMCCNGYLPVLADHHLFLPSPLPSFLLPASLLVSPHSLIGCGLASPVPAHLSTMDVKYSVHKLYSSTRPYVPTKLCIQSHVHLPLLSPTYPHSHIPPPPSPFSHTSHSHIPPPPSPFSHTPTHSHPPTFTPHPPSYGYETGKDFTHTLPTDLLSTVLSLVAG